MELLEPSKEACRNAKKRSISAHVGMLLDNYPNDETYGQLLLLDLLEHIEEGGYEENTIC